MCQFSSQPCWTHQPWSPPRFDTWSDSFSYIYKWHAFKSLDFDIIGYADDTCLIFSADTVADLYTKANNRLSEINNWLAQNSLVLNPTETKFIEFKFKKTLVNNLPMEHRTFLFSPIAYRWRTVIVTIHAFYGTFI